MSKIVFNENKIEILRSLVNDEKVSIGAIGLVIYFIEHEDNDIKVKNVSKEVKECSSSIGKYISELKEAGYLSIRRNIINFDGKIEMIYYMENIRNPLLLGNNLKKDLYRHNYEYALKQCLKATKLEKVSLKHLGAWYMIELSIYKKQHISLDILYNMYGDKVKNFSKYVKSYNKLNQKSTDLPCLQCSIDEYSSIVMYPKILY